MKIHLSSTLLFLSAALCVRAELPKSPTPQDTATWKDHGRTLPEPEVLQPRIDPALPHYTPRAPDSLSGHFKGAASDVLADLTKRWVAAFQKYYPSVTIDVPPPYAGSLGALELIDGKIDFVMVSRELKPTDVSGFRDKFGYNPFSAPIGGGTYRHFGFLDAIGFCVNPGNPIKELTFSQLDRIYSTTHARRGEAITTWGQLGLAGEWADKPIHLWGVKPWNGFEEFVRERVLSTVSVRGEWRPDVHFVETVFPINGAVAADKYAIGYAGLAYLDDRVKLLSLAKDDGGPYVPPSYEAVALAEYPLSRVTYINLNKPPGKPVNPVLGELMRFILSREGQQVLLDQAIYIPLRAAQAEASLKRLDM